MSAALCSMSNMAVRRITSTNQHEETDHVYFLSVYKKIESWSYLVSSYILCRWPHFATANFFVIGGLQCCPETSWKAFSKNKGPINCSSVSYLVNNIYITWQCEVIMIIIFFSINLIIIVWSWFIYLLNTGRPSLLPVIGHPGSSLSVWKLDPNTLSFPLKGLLPYEKVHKECQCWLRSLYMYITCMII